MHDTVQGTVQTSHEFNGSVDIDNVFRVCNGQDFVLSIVLAIIVHVNHSVHEVNNPEPVADDIVQCHQDHCRCSVVVFSRYLNTWWFICFWGTRMSPI